MKLSGLGYEAQFNAERLPVLHEAINMLCTDARNIYDTSTETLFVNARARMAYGSVGHTRPHSFVKQKPQLLVVRLPSELLV